MANLKIVSGGQTGADRAALHAARACGVPTGGWVPAGRLAEDGHIPADLLGLIETSTPQVEERTRLNVRDSDATLLVSHGILTGGARLTLETARELGKPVFHLDASRVSLADAVPLVLAWLLSNDIRCLNVAGPRASEDPQVYEATFGLLSAVLEAVKHVDPRRPTPA
jgi:hypothetical protein